MTRQSTTVLSSVINQPGLQTDEPDGFCSDGSRWPTTGSTRPPSQGDQGPTAPESVDSRRRGRGEHGAGQFSESNRLGFGIPRGHWRRGGRHLGHICDAKSSRFANLRVVAGFDTPGIPAIAIPFTATHNVDKLISHPKAPSAPIAQLDRASDF